MANSINLYQEANSSSGSGAKWANNSLLVVLGVLLSIGVVYGVFLWMKTSAQAETTAAQEEMNRYLAEIDGEESQLVNDAYLRIEEFSKKKDVEVVALNQLQTLEKTIIPESLVTEYSYDRESGPNVMNVSVSADFVDGISKQLSVFRNSGLFDSVQATSLDLGETGMTAQFALSISSEQEVE
jgi:hypothetical protein